MKTEFDIKQLYFIFIRHIYLFISVFLVVLVLTGIYLYNAKKIYQATTTLELNFESNNILGNQMESIGISNTNYWMAKEYTNTQLQIIQSRVISSRVIENLSHEDLNALFHVTAGSGDKKKRTADFVSILQSKISVKPVKNTSIVSISIVDSDPPTAALLANSIAQAYIEFNQEKRYLSTKDAAVWLSEQSVNLKKQVEESELALFKFKKENQVLASTFEAKQQMLTDTISEISRKLTDRQIFQKALQAKIDTLESLNNKDDLIGLPAERNEKGTVLDSMRLKYLDVKAKLKEKSAFYGERHPEILALRQEEEALVNAIQEEVNGQLTSFNIENKTIIAEIKELQKMLGQVLQDSFSLNKLDIDYSKLRREVETNRKLYDIILERTKQADLSSLLKSNIATIIDRALVPVSPIAPKKQTIILIGIILATLAGLAGVFLVEFLDTRIHDMDELEFRAGKNVLGVFPTMHSEESGMAAEIVFGTKDANQYVESLRTIRTNIKLALPDTNVKSLLVSSTVAKEGKTTISANLAISFSLLHKKTLLVDADMRKPRVHKVFGLDNKLGISTYMMGDKSLESVINRNVYNGLDVLTCGPIPPNPAEMIESKRFREMIEELKSMYDFIVIDSPPLVPVADSTVLASMVDGVVLVVKITEVSRDLLRRSISQLKKAGAKLVGPVINNIDLKHGSRYGGYYYYYQKKYSYYGSSSQTHTEEDTTET